MCLVARTVPPNCKAGCIFSAERERIYKPLKKMYLAGFGEAREGVRTVGIARSEKFFPSLIDTERAITCGKHGLLSRFVHTRTVRLT